MHIRYCLLFLINKGGNCNENELICSLELSYVSVGASTCLKSLAMFNKKQGTFSRARKRNSEETGFSECCNLEQHEVLLRCIRRSHLNEGLEKA